MHDESGLKAALLKEMRLQLPGFVIQAHADGLRSGVPDWSVDGNGRTSWLEFKHATPDFSSRGIQELTMLRLAAASYARYVVWWENAQGTGKRTLIVHPKNLKDLVPEAWCVGHNHRWLVEWIRARHGA